MSGLFEPAQGILHRAGGRRGMAGPGPGGQGDGLWDGGYRGYSCQALSLSTTRWYCRCQGIAEQEISRFSTQAFVLLF